MRMVMQLIKELSHWLKKFFQGDLWRSGWQNCQSTEEWRYDLRSRRLSNLARARGTWEVRGAPLASRVPQHRVPDITPAPATQGRATGTYIGHAMSGGTREGRALRDIALWFISRARHFLKRPPSTLHWHPTVRFGGISIRKGLNRLPGKGKSLGTRLNHLRY